MASSQPDPIASYNHAQPERSSQSVELPTIHFLLDASGSMLDHREDLVMGVNSVLLVLKCVLPPLSTVHCWGINDAAFPLALGTIGSLPLLTLLQYQPRGRLRLYWALEHMVRAVTMPGQHVLIVLTDGEDDDDPSRATATPATITRLLQARQQEDWLCIYLGAYPDALRYGMACGFREGNCRVFSAAHLIDTFVDMQRGLQLFLTRSPHERKLLAQRGIFAEDVL